MKQKAKQTIHYIYSIALSAMVILCGILLMIACLQIYRSGGEQIYTPEKVAAAFAPIAAPVYTCLGLLLGSIVLQLVLWLTPGKAPKQKQPGMQLTRLQNTRDPQQADPEKKTALQHLRGGRLALKLVCAAVCVLCSILFLFFALVNLSFYPEPAQATQYVISLMPFFGPCLTLALGYSVLTAYLVRRNTEKQITIYKQCPPLPQAKTAGKQTFRKILPYVVVVLSLALMVYGLWNGGWQDVLTKAVNICTECVGLG